MPRKFLKYRSKEWLFHSTAIVPVGGGGVEPFPAGSGASGLLEGEEDGFSIDATTYDSITDAVYVGGPVGGTVSVGENGVFSQDNVAMDSFLSNIGTSPKMVHFPTSPYVRWSPHNLNTQSQTFEHADWVNGSTEVTDNSAVAPDGTTTAGLWEFGSTGSIGNLEVSGIVSGMPYTQSVYFKTLSGGQWIRLAMYDQVDDGIHAWFDIVNGVVGTSGSFGSGWTYLDHNITSVGSGWYRLDFSVLVVGTLNQQFISQVTADGNSTPTAPGVTSYIWGAQINRGTIPTPYIATTSAAKIGIPQEWNYYEDDYAILSELAATNLLVQSEDLTATWTNPAGTSETSNSTTAPDGTTTADTVVEDGATSLHYIENASATTTAAIHTASVYLKYIARQWLYIGIPNEDGYVFYDILNGVKGTEGGGATGTITPIGDGWYRCTISDTCGAAASRGLYVASSDSDGNVSGQAGINGNAWYQWGAQLELGTRATSYIPTIGATATRAKDIVQVATSSIPFSATAGTVYADAVSPFTPYDHQCPWCVDDGTGNERIELHKRVTGEVHIYIVDGGVEQMAEATAAVWTENVRGQSTFAWAVNDAEVVFNSEAPETDVSLTLPTVTTLQIGSLAESFQFNGHIFKLVYVPRRVT